MALKGSKTWAGEGVFNDANTLCLLRMTGPRVMTETGGMREEESQQITRT